jgi:hypothetical protein
MYRVGILPSGKPMQAHVKGDLPVAGTVFTCVSCHLRSGLGSFEGGVVTPATTGVKLFKPFQPGSVRNVMGQSPESATLPPARPAYSDETLARALRDGVDPAGRTLDDVMPRYQLDDGEMAVMIAYLKSLSARFSPGISDGHVSVATVMTDDAGREEREAMLSALTAFVTARNNQAASIKKLPARGRPLTGGSYTSQEISLSVWLLKGPPETWRGQLEEYYRKEPVFALIGGITGGEWQPVHQFSEDNRIPCIFPQTDFPVISRTDWYTLYLSKGYYQEGETAARYLNGRGEVLKRGPVVQIVRDSREGRALSRGFQDTWRELGNETPVTLVLKAGEDLSAGVVQQMLAKERPAAVILWDGSAALAALDALGAGADNRPEMVFVSSSYLDKGLWLLKESVRDIAYITYPFRLPHDGVVVPASSDGAKKTANRSYPVTQVLAMALIDMKGNYYRDNFLDVIGMIADMNVPLYERLSFGPGQRYASKGCYIVQLSKGDKPVFVKKSDWVMH